MSNIYIQEPPTNGKVLLKTSIGDIDIELWSKEAPLACRNFVQLCLEGYYDNTIFHRVVKGFIVQGGDPTGTGTGGESIYGEPFKDEIHSRLRFNRRGLVAMANAGKDDNASQFFFTLAASPELQKKHTIFGKVAGKTIYNMVKLEEGEIDEDDRPSYPNKVLSTEVLLNPFPDIVPRVRKTEVKKEDKKEKSIQAVKNYKLLSFGDEAEDEEEELEEVNKKFQGKIKCVPGLVEVGEEDEANEGKRKLDSGSEGEGENVVRKVMKIEDEEATLSKAIMVRNKLNPTGKKSDRFDHLDEVPKPKEDNKMEKKKDNRLLSDYLKEQDKYKDMKSSMPKKGKSREEQTLELLMKFKQKINKAKEEEEEEISKERKDGEDEDWMKHELKCETKTVLAKDANIKTDDWFEITDPRNTLNKRRRENSKPTKSRLKENL